MMQAAAGLHLPVVALRVVIVVIAIYRAERFFACDGYVRSTSCGPLEARWRVPSGPCSFSAGRVVVVESMDFHTIDFPGRRGKLLLGARETYSEVRDCCDHVFFLAVKELDVARNKLKFVASSGSPRLSCRSAGASDADISLQ